MVNSFDCFPDKQTRREIVSFFLLVSHTSEQVAEELREFHLGQGVSAAQCPLFTPRLQERVLRRNRYPFVAVLIADRESLRKVTSRVPCLNLAMPRIAWALSATVNSNTSR